jgi:hypothetical protein
MHKSVWEVYAKLYHVTHNSELLKDAHNASGKMSGWANIQFGKGSHKALLGSEC